MTATPLARTVLPSLNDAVPVAEFGETVSVNVTLCPTAAGFADEAIETVGFTGAERRQERERRVGVVDDQVVEVEVVEGLRVAVGKVAAEPDRVDVLAERFGRGDVLDEVEVSVVDAEINVRALDHTQRQPVAGAVFAPGIITAFAGPVGLMRISRELSTALRSSLKRQRSPNELLSKPRKCGPSA